MSYSLQIGGLQFVLFYIEIELGLKTMRSSSYFEYRSLRELSGTRFRSPNELNTLLAELFPGLHFLLSSAEIRVNLSGSSVINHVFGIERTPHVAEKRLEIELLAIIQLFIFA